MDIAGTSNQPSSNTPVGRALRPVTEVNDRLPAREDRSARIPAREAAVAVERFRTPIPDTQSYPRIGIHPSQHAIHAYTALERSEELEYMSTVMGIDEYA